METATANREKIKDIRRRMVRGEISYEAAKIEAQPVIDAINETAKQLAKKHNVKASKVSFAAMMR